MEPPQFATEEKVEEKVQYDAASPPSPEYMDDSTNPTWNPRWAEVSSGLTTSEAQERLKTYGPNAMPDKKTNPVLEYLSNFWGPMPIMIWVAILILGLKTALLKKKAWPDFIMCLILQVVNGNLKWYNKKNAQCALDSLKAKMAPKAFVKRDGKFHEIEARNLVPGDIMQIDIGSIVAADGRLGPAQNMEVDQAALTGESLPSALLPGEVLLSSSVVTCGDGQAVVCATGLRTAMGRAAKLVASVKKVTRYDKILFYVALYLLCMAMFLMTIQFIYMTVIMKENIFYALVVVVAILIGALPIAMHVVCMIIMAMGALRLSEKSAVVSELTATEELSGMHVLCSDKTGTLTLNKLEIIVERTKSYGSYSFDDLVFYSAIACNRKEHGLDAIDWCITNKLKRNAEQWARMPDYPQTDFTPFDPKIKRTEAVIGGKGNGMRVCKGAPQVVLNLSRNKAEIKDDVEREFIALAKQGYRALGIAKAAEGEDWEMVGLLAIADPPRPDTKQVVEHAQELGIKVIMITGDHLAIGREVGKVVGIGENMLPSQILQDYNTQKLPEHIMEIFPDIIERCDGFAEVLPEHKFQIVQLLQRKYICGMTGDGVNDAPALRQANVGIAVSGSTDAARAAAAIILQEEGLSVIIDAIMRSKKVFERVKAYVIYRSATSLRLMGFFFCCTMFIAPDDWLPGNGTWPGAKGHGYRAFCGMTNPREYPNEQSHPWAAGEYGPFNSLAELEGLSLKYDSDLGVCKVATSAMAAADAGNTLRREMFIEKVNGAKLETEAACNLASFDFPLTLTVPFDHEMDPYNDYFAYQSCVACTALPPADTDQTAMKAWFQSTLDCEDRMFTAISANPHEAQLAMQGQDGTGAPEKDTVVEWWHELCSANPNTVETIAGCVTRLIKSNLHISQYFRTPTMVVIVLTCLNDFTVVSIAFDHVQISTDPNSWWLGRNIALGNIIGVNTLCWSIAAFLIMLDSMDPASPWCKKYGICMDYTQVLTGAFLQLSLSARLARTNARKMASWFWTSTLKRSVIMTMSFSVTAAILFAFTWPFCPGSGLYGWAQSASACDPHMSPIHVLFGAVIILYQIPIHLFRDFCYNTLFTYFLDRDFKQVEKDLPKKRALDDRCAKVMRELGLEVNEAKGIEEKRPQSVITDEDKGGCLPGCGDWSGPRLFIYDGGSKTMRCNPLGFFLLYACIGFGAILFWTSTDREGSA